MGAYTDIKAVLIIMFSYIFYLKVSGWQADSLKKFITGTAFNLVFSLFIRGMADYVREPYKSLILILLSSIFLHAVGKGNYGRIFINMSVAFAASCILFLLSTAVAVAMLIFFFGIYVIDFRVAVLTGVIEMISVSVIMRLKIEVSLSKKKGIEGTGIVLSGMALILYSLSREDWAEDRSHWLIFVGTVLCAAGLVHWLKRETIIAFNNRVQEIENARLKVHLDEVESENEFLDDVLRYFEERLHKEDKRLPAYHEVVEELANAAGDEKSKHKAMKVLEELKAARCELALEQSVELRKGKTLPTTGMMLLDAVFGHMLDRAGQKDIDFNLIVSGDISGITGIITQTKLETLAADLIVNAITATGQNDFKSILVYLWVSCGAYELRVDDSGIPFEIDTLLHLGKKRITTHAETGGSGIGYMAVFETIRVCGASLIITEKAPRPYSHAKNVTVRFDGKSQKIIRSYRVGQIMENMEKCGDGWIMEDIGEIQH